METSPATERGRKSSAVYQRLVPRLVPVYERLSGRRLWTELARLRELQWRSADEIEAQSATRLRTLLAHAASSVPHYRALFGESGLDPLALRSSADLARVPLTTKADLRHGFPDRVTAGALKSRRGPIHATSGSTGRPFLYFPDRASLDLGLASYLLFREWDGLTLQDTRLEIVGPFAWARSKRPAARLHRLARRLLLGEKTMFLLGLSLDLDGFIASLPRDPADRYFIRGYPSYLARVAIKLLEQGVELPSRPLIVVGYGETLTEHLTSLFQRAFCCPVANHYSTLEILHLAHSCPDNSELLHVNSGRAVVRVVGPDGADVPTGAAGRLVITDLANYVMPFINYDTGDRAVAGGPCPCGRGWPTLARLDGREIETITTPAGVVFPTPTLAGLFCLQPDVTRCVWDYQAIQIEADRVVLRIVPAYEYTPAFAERLCAELSDYLGPEMRISIDLVEQIESEPSGKRLTIKRVSALPE